MPTNFTEALTGMNVSKFIVVTGKVAKVEGVKQVMEALGGVNLTVGMISPDFHGITDDEPKTGGAIQIAEWKAQRYQPYLQPGQAAVGLDVVVSLNRYGRRADLNKVPMRDRDRSRAQRLAREMQRYLSETGFFQFTIAMVIVNGQGQTAVLAERVQVQLDRKEIQAQLPEIRRFTNLNPSALKEINSRMLLAEMIAENPQLVQAINFLGTNGAKIDTESDTPDRQASLLANLNKDVLTTTPILAAQRQTRFAAV